MKPSLAGLAFLVLAPTLARNTQAQGQPTSTGSAFKVVATPNENSGNNLNNDLFAAAASSASDIWAVGESTIHFDGVKWTAFHAPLINGDNTGALAGVVAISPTLAWAVGNQGTSLEQVIERWDGSEWSVFPGPVFQPHDQALLFGMTSTSADDIWAVGNLESANGTISYLFEHFDGQKWTATSFAENNVAYLRGVSAHLSNDVWAVGYQYEGSSFFPAVAHFDGFSWRPISSPVPQGGSSQLNAVQTLASNNVWAVGSHTLQGQINTNLTQTLIEHFDGTSWKVVPSPNVGSKTAMQSNQLSGLTVNNANDIWAFGSFIAAGRSGNQETLLLHWNGIDWTIAPSPDPTRGNNLSDVLFSGVTPSPGNVWIFGTEAESPFENTLVIHAINQ